MHFLVVSSLLIALPVALSTLLMPHLGAIRGLALGFLTFFVTLLSSITLYRICPFHPLAHYPGPLLTKVSKFWHLWNSQNGKQYLYIQALHNEYGDIVRIGEFSRFLLFSSR